MDAIQKKLRDSRYKKVVSSIRKSLLEHGYFPTETQMLYDTKAGCTGYGFCVWTISKFIWPCKTTFIYSSIHKAYFARVGRHYTRFDQFTSSSDILDYMNRYTLVNLT